MRQGVPFRASPKLFHARSALSPTPFRARLRFFRLYVVDQHALFHAPISLDTAVHGLENLRRTLPAG